MWVRSRPHFSALKSTVIHLFVYASLTRLCGYSTVRSSSSHSLLTVLFEVSILYF